MLFSSRNVALAASTLAAATEAANVVVANAVAAGVATTIAVNGLDASSGSFRTYLATTPSGWGTGVSCYLVNSTSTSTTTLSITIPVSIGPSGSYYSIGIASPPGSSSYTYSPTFSLTGASGNISAYEAHLNGSPLWNADDMPCAAYDCARQCAQKYYPADTTDAGAASDMTTCIKACPGVTPQPTSTSSSSSTGGVAAAASTQTKTLGPVHATTMTTVTLTPTGTGTTATGLALPTDVAAAPASASATGAAGRAAGAAAGLLTAAGGAAAAVLLL
ncbi:hypothetical protein B0A49_07076 [Cryomyces minteri]|uniref:Uncharacterized protein n=1 Tax=Cryomyces minteri TaxID=331657 RepID=A0A4U0WX89_9PEZI|nr:hypothetical protein B0A49_07076 [Cryomyces minteri]